MNQPSSIRAIQAFCQIKVVSEKLGRNTLHCHSNENFKSQMALTMRLPLTPDQATCLSRTPNVLAEQSLKILPIKYKISSSIVSGPESPLKQSHGALTIKLQMSQFNAEGKQASSQVRNSSSNSLAS